MTRATRLLATLTLLVAALTVVDSRPAVSATRLPGTFVFLQSIGNGDYRIAAMHADGTSFHVVTNHGAVSQPAFAPRGGQIVFAGPVARNDATGRLALFRVRIDGSELHQLTRPRFADRDPAWSPDGQWIAMTHNVNGAFSTGCCLIALVHPDGSAYHSVPNTTHGREPTWSPTSKQLAFVRDDGLYVVNLDGSGLRRVVSGHLRSPSWSPDGRRIAYERVASPTGSSIEFATPSGYVRSVSNPTGRDETPQWTEDSDHVIYLHYTGQGYDGRTGAQVFFAPVGATAYALLPRLSPPMVTLAYSSWLGVPETPGVATPSGGALSWRFTDVWTASPTDAHQATYGAATATPVVGDWNADGHQSPAVVSVVSGRLTWQLTNALDGSPPVTSTVTFGRSGDAPIVGDWNGDGIDSPGVARVVNGTLVFYLTDHHSGLAPTDHVCTFGSQGMIALAADWDGDGADTPAVARLVNGRWTFDFAASLASSPKVAGAMVYGVTGDMPITGDWDGDGRQTPGVVRPGNGVLTWFASNSRGGMGATSKQMTYGGTGGFPLVGRWG